MGGGLLVLDFDGTMTDAEAEGAPFREGYLGDIAIRAGRKIQWDPEQETIVGDPDAARLCSRPMRSPWRL